MSKTKLSPIVHVSLSDALEGVMSHRAIRIRSEDLPEGIACVRVPGVGKIPAVVALRTSLEAVFDPDMPGSTSVYQWKVIVSPYEANLLIRLFGRSKGRIDDERGVRYEAIPKIRQVHQIISMLEPPLGTVIQLTFAFTKSGDPELEWFASSTEREDRIRRAVINRNKLKIAKAFPFGWWVKYISRDLDVVPPDPGQDLWLEEHKRELGETVQSHFLPILSSLWRAAFSQDDVAKQLQADGYQINQIGKTRIGVHGLATTIRQQRGHLTHLTQLSLHDQE